MRGALNIKSLSILDFRFVSIETKHLPVRFADVEKLYSTNNIEFDSYCRQTQHTSGPARQASPKSVHFRTDHPFDIWGSRAVPKSTPALIRLELSGFRHMKLIAI